MKRMLLTIIAAGVCVGTSFAEQNSSSNQSKSSKVSRFVKNALKTTACAVGTVVVAAGTGLILQESFEVNDMIRKVAAPGHEMLRLKANHMISTIYSVLFGINATALFGYMTMTSVNDMLSSEDSEKE